MIRGMIRKHKFCGCSNYQYLVQIVIVNFVSVITEDGVLNRKAAWKDCGVYREADGKNSGMDQGEACMMLKWI